MNQSTYTVAPSATRAGGGRNLNSLVTMSVSGPSFFSFIVPSTPAARSVPAKLIGLGPQPAMAKRLRLARTRAMLLSDLRFVMVPQYLGDGVYHRDISYHDKRSRELK